MPSDQKFSMRPLYLQVRDLVLERITGGFSFPVNALSNGTLGGPLAFDGPFYRLRSPGSVVIFIRS